ncbi:MAG TPA: endolytic transglycosylase MltG [Gaiellaceae bacterium]|nr:endolytic transglycosylase MltG [Gaiellaceae bacterium]
MVERRPGVIPPKPGPPPGPPPSDRQLHRRRLFALVVLVLVLGGLGWATVAAIGGGSSKRTASSTAGSGPVIYTTETITTNGKTTQTVVAVPKPFRIVFPEGFTLKQMAARVTAVKKIAEGERNVRPLISSHGYLAAVRVAGVPDCLGRARARSMEGFLFPATYDFVASTTDMQLVDDQLSAFCENWSQVDLSYAKSKHLTPYDVLIIASMVEKETLSPDERPLVAAVIYNRLHDRMPLGIDSTLRYGLDIPPTQSILESQLHSSSPYNTRNHLGLPPTPIANPGLASMQAAAHPARVDYLYFVRKPDKKHHFFTASYRAFTNYERAHGYGVH